MDAVTKCCGNCAKWQTVRGSDLVGRCTFVMPNTLPFWAEPDTGDHETIKTDGSDCYCFAPRPDQPATRG